MTELPTPVTRYLDQPAIDQFTDDAVVTDEGRTHVGRDAVAAWLARSASEYTFTTTFTGATRDDDDHVTVTQHLEGDFPGGVVDLTYRFTLRGDLIAELHIAP